ncbi:MAG: sigma-54 dependent transcriptional regulator [Thermodesulfobacteriota bacterium]
MNANDKPDNRILVVDDEENMRHMLSALLTREGYKVDMAENGEKALLMATHNHYNFILCDIKMPRMDGMAFLEQSASILQDTTVIMMSAYGNMDAALESMKRGAYDYISKPFKPDEVILTLKKAHERERLKKENLRLKKQLAEIGNTYTFGNMVAKSSAMRSVVELISKVAAYDTTVLITGESGTGKELVARSLHFNSNRSKNEFVPINCGGIPENLLESELFGHVKGAFTGADKNKIGICETADRGTLFLDEIGELPISLQVKLLRLLQDNEIKPVGSSETRIIDIRTVAATSKNLEEEVARGKFREDLFYRLNVLHIHIPPLRERTDDIPYLCRSFIEKFNRKLNQSVEEVSPAAMSCLMRHNWPGNVRELENAIEHAVVLAESRHIEPINLPPAISLAHGAGSINGNSGLLEGYSIKTAQKKVEKILIQKALRQTGGNRTRASKLLEISHPSLLAKIKEYGIEETE